MKQYKHILILIVFICIGTALRLYRLTSIPNGLYQDETSIGYSAWSILHTGKDEHAVQYPLYFRSFGDYKLPVYIYLTVMSEYVFGLTAFAVRLPSAIFGILSIPLLYLFIERFTRNTNLALISSGLLTISPWHIHYSRAAFEVSVALPFLLAGCILLYDWFDLGKRGSFLFGTGMFILALYTYNLTRLLSPVLYMLTLFFLKRSKLKNHMFEYWLSAALGIGMLLPFLLTLFGDGGVSSATGTFLTSSAVVQARLLEFRSYLIAFPHTVSSILFNTYILTLLEYLNNIVSYFSVSFFFVNGPAHGNHGIGTMGLLYLFELPLLVLGIVHYAHKQTSFSVYMIAWFCTVILISSFTREAPHATRSFFLLVPLTVFIAQGLLITMLKLENIAVRKKNFLSICIGAFVFFQVSYFIASYFVRFPVAYASRWRQQDRDVALFLKNQEQNYDLIIIDTDSGYIYTSLLFYQAYDPALFHAQALWTPGDSEGFSIPQSFGTYRFQPLDWQDVSTEDSVLILTNAVNIPSDSQVLKTFTYPQRPVVLADKQNILSYPVNDSAYVAITKPHK